MPSNAEQLIKAGSLDEALAALQADVRARPADAKLRVFLFQMLAVLGQWDRALNQLNVAAEMDPATLLMAQVCRPALQCEALRTEVFDGKRTPMVLGQPAEWIGWMIQANQLTAESKHAAAAALRDKALEAAPATGGSIDGKPFEWLADADSRLGPLLEAIIDGRYYWVPICNLAAVDIDKPTDLRDVVWMPATLKLTNGGEKPALIPTRYAGSESDPDPAIRMARRTDWSELAEGVFAGRGQRLLATDAGEHALLEVRRIVLTPSS